MGSRESKVRVRAHFTYEPENDPYIPCKEAGLGFQRGDILHIVSQDDSYWWQARRESERTARAGLIPSRALQERRIIHERKQVDGDKEKSKWERSDASNQSSLTLLTPFPAAVAFIQNLDHVLRCVIRLRDRRSWVVRVEDPRLRRSCTI